MVRPSSVMIEVEISIFLQLGRSIMTEECQVALFNELFKRNQRNATAISSFLKTADRRYARKMNAQIAHPHRPHLNPPPVLLLGKHSPIVRNTQATQNSLSRLDQGKEGQLSQGHSYLRSKQRKQEIKSLLKFVRESREAKLKFYNIHAKKQDSLLEGKSIVRPPLHLKDIIFFGEGSHKLEVRRNNSMKCTLNTLPLLKVEKHNTSIHGRLLDNG